MKKKFNLHIVLLNMLSIFVCCAILCECFCFASEYSDTETIAPGLIYTEKVTYDGASRESSFFFDYDHRSGTALRFLYGGGVYGLMPLGKMINSERENLSENESIVGGLNCDFFSMKTGVPMSAIISDGELISSDDSRTALGILSDGSGFIGAPKIQIEFSGDNFSYPVGHINKYPTPYATYLLTDKYGSTTKSTYPSTEIVLMPVSDVYTPDLYNHPPIEYTLPVEPKPPVEIMADGSAESIEAVTDEMHIDGISSDISIHSFDFSKYRENAVITASGSVRAVVTEIRYSVSDSEIPEGCFVLCADDRPYKEIFEAVSVGEVYNIKTSCAAGWEHVNYAVGGGSVLVSDGAFVPQENDSLYTSKNPRSAMGIRQDGSMVFYAVDGRRSGYSTGLTASSLAERLISLGCTDAINFDGGGSTTVYSALPGKTVELVNRPSDGSERGISTSAIFVNVSEKTNQTAGFYLDIGDFYLLGGGSGYYLPDTVFVHDDNYHALPSVFSSDCEFFTEDDENGYISENGRFISGNRDGEADIMCRYDGVTDIATKIHVTNSLDVFKTTSDTYFLEKETKSAKLSASGSLNLLPVYMDIDKLVYSFVPEKEWGNTESFMLPYSGDFGTISEDGVLTVSDEYPFETLGLSVTAGDKSDILSFTVKQPVFRDMGGHWSKDIALSAYGDGIMEGVILDDFFRYFLPENEINAAQLCAMSARLLSLDTSEYNKNSFVEAGVAVSYSKDTEWSLPYAAALLEKGLLAPLTHKVGEGCLFDADLPVTRAMAMMLIGSFCLDESATVESYENFLLIYPDMSTYAENEFAQNINNALIAGIFGGYPDGTMKPDKTLTRAQTAAVFVRMYDAFSIHDGKQFVDEKNDATLNTNAEMQKE